MNTLGAFDRVTRVAPIGVRFWDAVTQEFVGGGLDVTAYPRGAPTRRVRLVPNRASVYVAHALPGLREAEAGAGDDAYWAGLTARRPFVIEVEDPSDRFLPLSFTADLPARGLFVSACLPARSPGAADASADGLPLFSSPTRRVASTFAVVRAELWDPQAPARPGAAGPGAPAAGAVLTVQAGREPPARGVADAEGRVAVFLHYPEPENFPDFDSPIAPPGSPDLPLTSHTWPVTLTAAFARGVGRSPFPDVCAVLAQPAARLAGDASGATPLPAQVLAYGRELLVKSRPAATDPLRAKLFLFPS